MSSAHASTDTIFAPGRELDGGKYRLIRLLGSGGMGAVFEAENTLTHKRVAIKCLHAVQVQQPEASARLLREAEAASRVRHPHVVDVYDVGREGESLFLVMEYLEGEPLRQLMSRGSLPIHELIALLLLAMRGVAAAHRLGVVHRDIKPDNIFLAREADNARPVPKVLDFGISKLLATDADQVSLTRSGSVLGTPRYMAYEQLVSGTAIDGRVDVYAFGVILYEALTGCPPYDADTYPALILKIANAELTPPKQLRPELPSTLDRLVCWALERDRERRTPSIEQLIRELEPFASARGLEAEMTIAHQVGVPLTAAGRSTLRARAKPAESERTRPEPRRPVRRTLIVCTTLGMLALLLTAAWTWLRSSERVEGSRNSLLPEPGNAVPQAAVLDSEPAATRTPPTGAAASAPELAPADIQTMHATPLAEHNPPRAIATEVTPPHEPPGDDKSASAAATDRSRTARTKPRGVKAVPKLQAAAPAPAVTAQPLAASQTAAPAEPASSSEAPATHDPKPRSDVATPPTAAELNRAADSLSPPFRVKVPQSKDF